MCPLGQEANVELLAMFESWMRDRLPRDSDIYLRLEWKWPQASSTSGSSARLTFLEDSRSGSAALARLPTETQEGEAPSDYLVR
jgi:hypothetical protein